MDKITKENVDEAIRQNHLNAQQEPVASSKLSELHISGGVLKQVSDGVYYYGDNGSSCFFKGAKITTSLATGGAYQLNGWIHVDPSWTTHGFNVYDFAHEYGHYLQQQKEGLKYYETAVKSLYSAIYASLTKDWDSHTQKPYEQEATALGNEYLKEHMKK